ncbi:hypothetical protein SDC9_192734 [bioreactor metagenome]|uniref:Uncharacterized protein n=1 Tax=bioreactor metagenome TaxID=1076179 RepID=A0A645I1J5_9ZZZZ
MHAGDALENIVATGQRQRSGQRTKGRAGIAEEEFCLLDRKAPAASGDTPVFASQMDNAQAQRLERIEHALGIVGSQQVANLGLTFREGRQQQDTVGDTL